MRRLLLLCAIVQGLLLLAVGSAIAATHGSAGPLARRRHVLRTKPAHAAPHRSARLGARQGAGRARLSRGRRTGSRLHPTQPVTTALIDPVPRGRFAFPPPLKGTHESLLRQNVRSAADGLERVRDDADLLSLRQRGQLVALPETAALTVDERLPANRRYCRPWTAQFLSDVSRVHYGRFHRPLQVNSAVRTVEYQRHLELVNGNAAPADGDDASPHLTGATIDIAKKGLSTAEIGWMRAYLMPLQTAGKIDVEEEFYQSCFHISVYRSYRPSTPDGGHDSRPGSRAALLASRMR